MEQSQKSENSETLDHLFNPKSVALVGASNTPGKWGYFILMNIILGGFKGEIYPINPKEKEILGHTAYPSIQDVPGSVDLPLTISDVTYTGGDAGVVDIHFSNFLATESFGEGVLAQLSLAVPSNWTNDESVSMWTDSTAPGGFGLPMVPTTAGSAFELTTTPEPATTVLALLSLVFGGSYAARRRKKNQP